MTMTMTTRGQRTPIVSVVLPVSRTRWLTQALSSIRAQSFRDYELIIVLDAPVSADYPTHSPAATVLPYTGKSLGALAARSRGAAAARGEWIALLDDDDVWEPGKLERQLSDDRISPDTVLLYGGYRRIDAHGVPLSAVLPVPPRLAYEDILSGCPIGNSSVLIRRDRWPAESCAAGLPMRCDYVVWLEALRPGGHALGISDHLVDYRVHKAGISANKIKAAYYQWQVLRRQGLALGPSLAHWLRYAGDNIWTRLKEKFTISPWRPRLME